MSESAESSKLQQARKPEEISSIDDRLPTLRTTLLGGGLLGLAVTAAAIGSNAIEQSSNKREENYSSLSAEMLHVDTSRLKIIGKEVRIRSEARKPEPHDIQQGDNNLIKNVKTINGVEWNGESDFEITNAPYIIGEDPSNRMQKGAWMVLEVETDSGSHELGYISNSGATRSIIETVTKGERGNVEINENNQLKGILDSGKTITEGEIGKIEIIKDQPSN